MEVKSIALRILEVMWVCPPGSGSSSGRLRILPDRDEAAPGGHMQTERRSLEGEGERGSVRAAPDQAALGSGPHMPCAERVAALLPRRTSGVQSGPGAVQPPALGFCAGAVRLG